jgi:crotonyl-CoA carboxylase/reductase
MRDASAKTHPTPASAGAVAKLDVEPGELPATMAAWVIRQEREGEPIEAFQLEQIEVPEPGPFEVVVRVMGAGVNFNGVWAALGLPVSVFGYGDHPEYGHHIGGSDASGIVWKVGEGITRWKPGDEVVLNTGQYSYEDYEVHGFDPTATRSGKAWGYETTWGSFAQFTKVQAQQLLPRPRNLSWVEASSYGLSYFTAYRMLMDKCGLQVGQRVLVWGAAGGLGVFAIQLCAAAGANAVGVVASEEKGEMIKQLGAVDYVNRNEFGEMMRTPESLADPAKESNRAKASRAFAKRVKSILGEAPDIVFEHVGSATFPTSVFTVKPFGKVVICGATTGFNLDFDARYLWMRQKQILGSHGANAYQAMKANQLVAAGKIRPLLSRTMSFAEVPEAHQLMMENKHLGKIAIRVGAEDDDVGREESGPGAIRGPIGSSA